ncbi:hypothetical protein QBC44DRAFT_248421 [Cladorrhinum sp. PSN332]|nr:hypothetical protein QBC44DRAFT_248421 [Cladorrhinum sp. PSN332]
MSASTALAARHAAIRNSTRVRPSVSIKIKTGSLDSGPSEEKAQAMASSDWRSSGIKRRSDENDRRSSSVASSAFELPPGEMEPDDLPPAPNTNKITYHRPHRPSEEKAGWEMTCSVPAWKLPPSVTSSASGSRAAGGSASSYNFSLSFLGLNLEDVTMVQLKKITPLLVPLNGENVELPNQLCLDITPIESSDDWEEITLGENEYSAGRPVVGALRRMTGRTRVRRLTSEESYDTLEDLRQILAHERPVLVPRSIKEEPWTERSSEDRTTTDSGISELSDLGSKTQTEAPSNLAELADQDRFRILLSHLGLPAPQTQCQSRTQAPASRAQILDPAIITAKPKYHSDSKDSRHEKKPDTFFGQNPKLFFTADAKRSGDSGYGSFQFGRSSESSRSLDSSGYRDQAARSRKEQSGSSASTSSKKLNPAAAEFKFVAARDPVPVISPKKITRTPLTNIFPNVLGNAAAPSHPMSPSRVRGYPPRPMWSPERKPAEASVPMVPIPPLFGAEGKIDRPYFPVTQKPRDHDPVKQQMYESYLEWRKANEPGYHMKCKMRQAHRVVRQYQGSVTADETTAIIGGANAEWKTIAEKAKAAASAIAAATEKEKKTKEQLIREELKAKIQMASAAIKKEQQQSETSIKEEAGTMVSAAA